MNSIECIKLTHANTKGVMYLPKPQIAGFYFSDGHKCTHVVATGGAVFPAMESVEEIRRLIETDSQESKPQEGATHE